ncbi:MAG: Rieske 2Fe-2S domain-containing protein [Nitrospirales bacterium]|nr:Rieske 2Fe-2S domain-containing protein [Nitrospirales bacterium]
MADVIRVAGVEDVMPGKGIVAEVNGKSIAVFNVEGMLYAIDNTCVHRGGPLGEGDLDGEVVSCPWHGWEYNVKTGACVNNPSACVVSYPVQIDGSDVKVEV